MLKSLIVLLGLIQTIQSKISCTSESGAMTCADKESIFAAKKTWARNVPTGCYITKKEPRLIFFKSKGKAKVKYSKFNEGCVGVYMRSANARNG